MEIKNYTGDLNVICHNRCFIFIIYQFFSLYVGKAVLKVFSILTITEVDFIQGWAKLKVLEQTLDVCCN